MSATRSVYDTIPGYVLASTSSSEDEEIPKKRSSTVSDYAEKEIQQCNTIPTTSTFLSGKELKMRGENEFEDLRRMLRDASKRELKKPSRSVTFEPGVVERGGELLGSPLDRSHSDSFDLIEGDGTVIIRKKEKTRSLRRIQSEHDSDPRATFRVSPLLNTNPEEKPFLPSLPSSPELNRTLSESHIHGASEKIHPSIHEAQTDSGKILNKLNYFRQMSTPYKFYFQEQRAAKEIASCLRDYPTQTEEILKNVLSVENQLKEKYHRRHFRETLICLGLDLEYAHTTFLNKYFKDRSPEIVKDFGEKWMCRLIKKKFHSDIIKHLNELTKIEFSEINKQTFLRGSTLSSACSVEYAKHLWEKELKELSKKIQKMIKKYDIHTLCIVRKTILNKLESTNSKFKMMSEIEKEELISPILLANLDPFKELLRFTLTHVYHGMSFPAELSELLQMRRFHILSQKVEVDESRVFVSTDLILRVLNPYILFSDTSPPMKDVLLGLTKVIQALANELPFAEKVEEPFDQLNDVFKEFLETHRSFIDLHTKPRSPF